MGTLLLSRVAPVYPPLARQARIQGTVVLRIIVNRNGEVRDVQLVSGHPMLAPAAIEAVKQWKYVPYVLDHDTVEVQSDVQVNFRLATDPASQGIGSNGATNGGVIAGVIASLPPTGDRVSEAVMRPRRTQKVEPVYPAAALQAHVEGMVVLNVRIGPSGNVERADLISGHPMLAASATEAVKQWKYTPYERDGNAVAVGTIVRLSFTLGGDGTGTVSEPAPVADVPRVGLPKRVRVSSGVSQGLLLKKVAPLYPPDARAAYIQGTVVMQVNIDKEGNISYVELVSGHPMLAPAAMEAVRQWKYRPYLLNGEAVEVETTIQVNFALR